MTTPETAADAAINDPIDESPTVAISADARLVRELAEVLHDTGLTEIEMERGDLRIRVVKALPVAPAIYAAPAAPAATHVVGQAPAPASTRSPAGGTR